jgi:translation initiation factor IF-2
MTEKTDQNTKNEEGKKTLTLKTLQLRKPVERDQIKQSFSHGRSKTVEVEVRRKRPMPGEKPAAAPTSAAIDNTSGGKKFTTDEFDVRLKAVQEAIKSAHREAENQELPAIVEEAPALEASTPEESTPLVEEPTQTTEPQATAPASTQAKPLPQKPERISIRQLPKKKTISAEDITPIVLRANSYGPSKQAAAQTKDKNVPVAPAAPDVKFVDGYQPHKPAKPITQRRFDDGSVEGEEDARKSAAKADLKRPAPARKTLEAPRKLSQTALKRALDGDSENRQRSEAAMRRARQKQKNTLHDDQEGPRLAREVIVPEMINVGELANRMAVRSAEIIKSLMKMGMMVTVNQSIDADTAELVCDEFGHKCKRVADSDIEIGLKGIEDTAEQMQPRPPVVTVMGHVDHGKTSLLDALRRTDVVSGEAGGITQHIGAYQVTLSSGKKITFIDTPGHAAFSEMRARGANITDVVILVVAADDSIKEQTVEALNHAKAAGVPIVVAINKIDKPGANVARVRTDLMQHGIVTEEFGGDVLSVEVSAKAGTNLDKLEEAILLQAELLDLKANPDRPGDGVIVEAKMDKGRGPVATALISRGTLNVGDIVVAGREWGRVRALVNDHGSRIDIAPPAMPVEILGFDGVPSAGDELVVVESEAKAREITDYRRRRTRDAQAAAAAKSSMENMLDRIAAGEMKELPLVIKTDVQGSLEAITASLNKLGNEEVKVRVLHGGVGGINESDVTLARASGGVIIGFNIRANAQARDMAKRDSVDIRYYSIIYNVLDDVKGILSGLLAPTVSEKYLGTATIREIFTVGKSVKIAGCYVTEGLIRRGTKARVLRDSVVVFEGDLRNLRRFKDEAKEVKEGYECGISFDNYNDLRTGDAIECFEMESISRQL